MANLICGADGNLTAAATWRTIDTTYVGDAAGSNAAVTATDKSSANFTPGAITVDGVALRLYRLQATPAASNTLTVTLYNATDGVNVVSLAYNVNQLPNIDTDSGWIFFKFDANYTLIAGKAYNIKLKVSTITSQPSLNFFTLTTTDNWMHMLRTTTTQAPAAGDQMFILGELASPSTWTTRTVSMDSTAATDYGTGVTRSQHTPAILVSKNGTLTWLTAESTNYILRLSGDLQVKNGGTLNMGTVANPCPRNSTMLLEFDTGVSKSYYLELQVGSICTMQGLSRTAGNNTWRTELSASSLIGDTTLDAVTDTGWLSGDSIAISPTESWSHGEVRTLSGNATASVITLSSGLTYDHKLEYYKSLHTILLTRNVKIQAITTANAWLFDCGGQMDVDWVQFYYGCFYPTISGTALKTFDYCSIDSCYYSSTSIAIYVATSVHPNNFHFNNIAGLQRTGTFISTPTSAVQFNQTNWTFANIDLIGISSPAGGITIGGTFGADTTINNIRMGGFSGNFSVYYQGMPMGTSHLFNDLEVYCTGGAGYHYHGGFGLHNCTFSRWNSWANAGPLQIGSSSGAGTWVECTWNDIKSVANNSSASTGQVNLYGRGVSCVFNNWTTYSITGKISSIGIHQDYGSTSEDTGWEVQINNSSLNSTTTPFVDHIDGIYGSYSATGVQRTLRVTFRKCVLSHPDTLVWFGNVGSTAPISYNSFVAVDGPTDDLHYKLWFRRGRIDYETTIYRTTAPSMKMTPLSTTLKLCSGVRHVPVVDGAAAKTITCYIRKNGTYNGAAPRIILKANYQLGVTTETVIATATLTNADTWYSVSGALPVATDDGIYEICVDCDGTAGSIFVDDWAIS